MALTSGGHVWRCSRLVGSAREAEIDIARRTMEYFMLPMEVNNVKQFAFCYPTEGRYFQRCVDADMEYTAETTIGDVRSIFIHSQFPLAQSVVRRS
jgi:hypothetical protein